MDEQGLTCPYCGADVPLGTTACPSCDEDLAAWARLRYGHAIDYNEALALAREGRLAEARVQVGMALQQKEDFAPAHILAAKIAAQQGRWADAQRGIARAQELLPEDERVREMAEEIAHQVHAVAARGGGEAVAEAGPAHGLAYTLLHPWRTAYQRDIVKAFAVGVGLTTVLATLVARLMRGRRG